MLAVRCRSFRLMTARITSEAQPLLPILIRGNYVGINGTPSPQAKLDVKGTIKITDGTQGEGKVLTSDAREMGAGRHRVEERIQQG